MTGAATAVASASSMPRKSREVVQRVVPGHPPRGGLLAERRGDGVACVPLERVLRDLPSIDFALLTGRQLARLTRGGALDEAELLELVRAGVDAVGDAEQLLTPRGCGEDPSGRVRSGVRPGQVGHIRYVAISGPVSSDAQPRSQKSDDTRSPTSGAV